MRVWGKEDEDWWRRIEEREEKGGGELGDPDHSP